MLKASAMMPRIKPDSAPATRQPLAKVIRYVRSVSIFIVCCGITGAQRCTKRTGATLCTSKTTNTIERVQ